MIEYCVAIINEELLYICGCVLGLILINALVFLLVCRARVAPAECVNSFVGELVPVRKQTC